MTDKRQEFQNIRLFVNKRNYQYTLALHKYEMSKDIKEYIDKMKKDKKDIFVDLIITIK